MEVLEAEQRVDVQAGDRVRVALGHLLDVHPALVESITSGRLALRSKTIEA